MAVNVERFKKDLDRLVHEGIQLENAMIFELSKDACLQQVRKAFNNDKARVAEFIAQLPTFKTDYERWYSTSLAVLRQLLPDRVNNFMSLYEKPKGRKDVSYGNYVIQDYMQNLRSAHGVQTLAEPSAALPQYRQQLAILKAAYARFDSALFEIRQLVQADLFDSEIDAARELLKTKFSEQPALLPGSC